MEINLQFRDERLTVITANVYLVSGAVAEGFIELLANRCGRNGVTAVRCEVALYGGFICDN
jgi:hypothetical protein